MCSPHASGVFQKCEIRLLGQANRMKNRTLWSWDRREMHKGSDWPPEPYQLYLLPGTYCHFPVTCLYHYSVLTPKSLQSLMSSADCFLLPLCSSLRVTSSQPWSQHLPPFISSPSHLIRLWKPWDHPVFEPQRFHFKRSKPLSGFRWRSLMCHHTMPQIE